MSAPYLRPSDVAAWPTAQWNAFMAALTREGITRFETDGLDFTSRLLSADPRHPPTPPSLVEDCRILSYTEKQLLAAWFWPNPWLNPVSVTELMCFTDADAATDGWPTPVSARRRVTRIFDRIISAVADLTTDGNRGLVFTCISETSGEPRSLFVEPRPPISRYRLVALFNASNAHIGIDTLFTIARTLSVTADDRWWVDNPALLRLTFDHLGLRRRLASRADGLGFEELRDLLDRAEHLGAENQADWRDAAQPWEFHARLPDPPGESKYRLLFDELDSLPGDQEPVTFSLLYVHELLLPHESPVSARGRPEEKGLALSAFKHNAWWSNNSAKAHTHAWLAAGFTSTSPRWKGPQSRRDPKETRVTFVPMPGRELWWPHREQLRRDPNTRPVLGAALPMG